MEQVNTLLVRSVSVLLLLASSCICNAGFLDPFDSPTLDPAWQVVPFAGSRVYGYSSPANHYSLSDRPGYLRYILDPMTHADGFWLDYQTTYGLHSCCNHDPGLELQREITGDQWDLEAGADFHLPYTNGRALDLNIYFGDGNPGLYLVRFQRSRDVNGYFTFIYLQQGTGDYPFWGPLLASFTIEEDVNGPADATLFYRLERRGGLLTALWSGNGQDWNTAFSQDLGDQLNGRSQMAVITGLSWYNPGGSYADWDYVGLNDVPEPGSGVLVVAGGILLLLRRVSRRCA